MNETDILNQLSAIWPVLKGGNGLAVAAIAWVGLLRVGFKLVSGRIESLAAAAIKFYTDSRDDEALDKINRLLHSRSYRLLAFVADYIASIKLPLRADTAKAETLMTKLATERRENAGTLPGDEPTTKP